ncbi:2-oxo acid dehydrogenase subunit E2 [Rhizobium cremeum]|uniref:dihydrolipoamide acetyltransferase family protein n=1 Tax=Rhizobium cremeum TaxID=2813827 RepID=UPI001FCFA22F|nr:dihydrolipoamide acetyltransferase family protein [Rhizobium cremeum]MCJ7995685.1 2-oxo acid dehydrogenase subunit E2 [Rhizobium cremeum]MCJ8001183.1 2-oxo acid dehydrogenase subunit E2 [Rhizobium cremeum]
MSEYVLNMPDVGEGVAEAELVEWHVKPGDPVREDMVLAAVMTDKATVEIPSPVAGIVTWLAAEVGDSVAVRAPLVRIEIASGSVAPAPVEEPQPVAKAEMPALPVQVAPAQDIVQPEPSKKPRKIEPLPMPADEAEAKPLAAPAVRHRAQASGVDLNKVKGTGPEGRITHEDLDAFLASGPRMPGTATGFGRNTAVEEIRITGLRRKIAEKVALSAARIPHITYVEEVDVTDLEGLRAAMNGGRRPDQPKLTILPFLMRALVRAVEDQPAMNATFDDETGVITRYGAVHVGIATQTPAGLSVPVVRHAEALGLWGCAAELGRVAEAARTGRAAREELTGSTITISSLGSLGGIVSTPIINHPEVAIIGVNKIVTRPMWDGRGQFIPRRMMNLSSSFDHRVVDGWDAATFVQRLKTLLETPALIFVED